MINNFQVPEDWVDFTEYDELLGLDVRIECRAYPGDMLERIASDCFQSHIFEPDNDYV